MKPPDTVTEPPSRRTEHKRRTRLALRTAALELFSTKGYDDATTEEIAERAGVSARTFFRYFPTKESVLWAGQYDWVQAFSASLLEQPRDISDADAMCNGFIAAASSFAKNRRYLALYHRAVASSTTLRGRAQDLRDENVSRLAAAVAARHRLPQADERCSLLAAVCLLVYTKAIMAWLAGPANADLTKLIETEFTLLRSLFDDA